MMEKVLVIKAENPNFAEAVYIYAYEKDGEIVNFTFHNRLNDWIILEVMDNIDYYDSDIDLEKGKVKMALRNEKEYIFDIVDIEEFPLPLSDLSEEDKEYVEDVYPDLKNFIKDTQRYSIF